jgi:tRNA-binding EMAP/Myf-like protein
MEPISIDDFKKVEITVGEIMSAERIEGSDKLLKLKVNFGLKPSEGSADQSEAGVGEDIRQVLSGIAAYFPDPSELVGKRVAFATNLAPRMMMGLESQAMILASGGGEEPLSLLTSTAAPGSKIH